MARRAAAILCILLLGGCERPRWAARALAPDQTFNVDPGEPPVLWDLTVEVDAPGPSTAQVRQALLLVEVTAAYVGDRCDVDRCDALLDVRLDDPALDPLEVRLDIQDRRERAEAAWPIFEDCAPRQPCTVAHTLTVFNPNGDAIDGRLVVRARVSGAGRRGALADDAVRVMLERR